MIIEKINSRQYFSILIFENEWHILFEPVKGGVKYTLTAAVKSLSDMEAAKCYITWSWLVTIQCQYTVHINLYSNQCSDTVL